KYKRTNHRIHYLSQVGYHFGTTSAPDEVIASSEVATIMYYAKRETLDLLGITNPEIIAAPLRTPAHLLRRIPDSDELPYLIFKRVNPGLVEKHEPAYVYTFDFDIKDIMKEKEFEELTDQDLFVAIQRWERRFRDLHGPLYG